MPDSKEVAALAPLAPAVPPDLGSDGAELWSAVSQAASAWLAPSDSPTLLLLCELYDRRAMLKRHFEADGPLIMRPDGHMVANPVAQMLATTEKQIVDIASSLGLTPADRTRMGLAEVKAQNAFEEMLAKRQNRG
jgi:P27 family predicted phage terminase small subunit